MGIINVEWINDFERKDIYVNSNVSLKLGGKPPVVVGCSML